MQQACGRKSIVLRRGLQALHEICAGDPEGVAVNLLDAHLRSNTTEAVTVDDVSEQMSLLGIADKSLAWIGARAALWRRLFDAVLNVSSAGIEAYFDAAARDPVL